MREWSNDICGAFYARMMGSKAARKQMGKSGISLSAARQGIANQGSSTVIRLL
jgi:hypothetical protein